MDRVIFHIDVNSAFLSWSALKIIASGGADIREVPSVVSGDPEYRRSIITAKSIPAKKFGINTADPLSSALRKCPSLVVVPPDFEWYSECSRKFIAICREYSQYDETGHVHCRDCPLAIGNPNAYDFTCYRTIDGRTKEAKELKRL